MKKRFAIALICTAVSLWLLDRLFPLPAPYQEKRFSQVVVAADGQPLRAFADKQGIWRQPTTPAQVSPNYLTALLHYEDKFFYWHPGVNPYALVRAGWQWLRHGRIVSGGSTLTMQVARLLSPHRRTPLGKLQQIARSLQLEWHYSKQEILTLYLNLAPFGGPIEGVEAASHAYFGKSAAQLSQAEAALLAIMPQAPSRFRPDRYPQRARQARDKLVKRLVDGGIWPTTALTDVALEPVIAQHHYRPMLAPLLARRLVSQYPNQPLLQSSLQKPLQQALQQLATDYLSQYPLHTGLAIMVLDNQSQRPIGYLGSGEFGSRQRLGYVDMAQAVRSPGSTLKPFIYGLAIDQGLIHSASLLVDAPRFFSDYRPANFSGKFQGPITAADALTRSLNVPAVELLAHLGPKQFYTRMVNAGAKFRLSDTPGLPIALGAASTNLEQLVALYASLMNEGQLARISYLKDEKITTRPLMSPQAAWMIYEILRNQRRTDQPFDENVTGRRNNLAWKTGTSHGHRDMWAVGVSPKYTIGVWIGRPDGTSMPGHFGARTATPLLLMLANLLADNTPPPEAPPGVIDTTICWPLGKRALQTPPELCQEQHQAWLLGDQEPATLLAAEGENGSLMQSVWLTAEGTPTLQRCDDAVQQVKIALWPLLAEPWVAKSQRRHQQLPMHGCDNQPVARPLFVVTPRQGSRYLLPPTQSSVAITAKVMGGGNIKYWYLDGELLGQSNNQLQRFSVSAPGRYQLLVSDNLGNSDLVEFELK
ncbi:penicillin-binding protein 1C [Corallincola luteus]|uniref:penicillin-binding protein 1C n=1 Tax=Corallincola luteus TaxID=1775177 RepID=UPI00196B681A|nr:penicillin-binding protein 1C [Corallincola luteus]